MEQFNLEKWLKDKSQKIVTRDGRPVRIVCWDCKNEQSIIALTLEPKLGIEIPRMYSSNGIYSSRIESSCDLFFADEEQPLTEFEKRLKFLCEEFQKIDPSASVYVINRVVKDYANELLELARKELVPIQDSKTFQDCVKEGRKLEREDLEEFIEDKIAEKLAELQTQPFQLQPNPYEQIAVLYGCPTDFQTYSDINKQEND